MWTLLTEMQSFYPPSNLPLKRHFSGSAKHPPTIYFTSHTQNFYPIYIFLFSEGNSIGLRDNLDFELKVLYLSLDFTSHN